MIAAVVMLVSAQAQVSKPVEIADEKEVRAHRHGGRLWLPAVAGEPVFREDVTVHVQVDERGVVTSAKAGDNEIIPHVAEAVALVKKQRYSPFLRNGRAVPAEFVEDVNLLPRQRYPQKIVPMPEVKDWKTVVMKLTRTQCFGECPAYQVEVRGDGTVRFEGTAYTGVLGVRQGKVTAASARQLWRSFREAHFFSLDNQYASRVTDNPTFVLELSYDGRSKSVVDYVGIEAGMPPSVTKLEKEVDRVAGTEKWIQGER